MSGQFPHNTESMAALEYLVGHSGGLPPETAVSALGALGIPGEAHDARPRSTESVLAWAVLGRLRSTPEGAAAADVFEHNNKELLQAK